MQATALIAEDEPLLAAALAKELSRAWPDLRIVMTVGDGASAVQQALRWRPDVLFFDIRMPQQNGLEAAAELVDLWDMPQASDHEGEVGQAANAAHDAAARPFPQLVFVTAYDQYAVQAFDAQAVDYVLKPVQPERLQKTVFKVQQALVQRQASGQVGQGLVAQASHTVSEATLQQLRQLLAPMALTAPASHDALAPLQMIQASMAGALGNAVRMVPIDEVIYFEAADKYLRVLTTTGEEYLIRTPLKDLLPRLDAQVFWQIHRGTIVRASSIDVVFRDEAGKLSIKLHGRSERLAVSRLYAHLFKAM